MAVRAWAKRLSIRSSITSKRSARHGISIASITMKIWSTKLLCTKRCYSTHGKPTNSPRCSSKRRTKPSMTLSKCSAPRLPLSHWARKQIASTTIIAAAAVAVAAVGCSLNKPRSKQIKMFWTQSTPWSRIYQQKEFRFIESRRLQQHRSHRHSKFK